MSQLSEERIWLSDSGEGLGACRGESCIRSTWLVPIVLAAVVLPPPLSVRLELLVSRRLLQSGPLAVDELWLSHDEDDEDEQDEEEEEEEEVLDPDWDGDALLVVLSVVRLRADPESPEDVMEDAEEGERHDDVEELASDIFAEHELADRPLTTGYRMLLRFARTGASAAGGWASSARRLACCLSAASRASHVSTTGPVSDAEDVSVAAHPSGLAARGREAVLSRLEQHVPDMGVFKACT